MKPTEISDRLSTAEQALAERRGLRATGFWPAVAAVRGDRSLARDHADAIAAIDRQAFEQLVRLRTPLRPGLAILGAGVLVGVVIAALAAGATGAAQTVLFVAAWAVLNLCTHPLAHWAAGTPLGIRFTHAFIGHFPDPFPGMKIDYATYLRSHPRARALMHASGAIVSKIVPFALLGVAFAIDATAAAVWALAVICVGGLVADTIGWFVAADWKKTRRELRAARTW